MSISVNTLVTTSTVDSDSNWMTNAYSAFALPLKLRSLPSSNVFGNYGSRGGFRTPNPAVNSRMLYRWATLELKMAWTVGNAPTFYSFGDCCISCLPRPYYESLMDRINNGHLPSLSKIKNFYHHGIFVFLKIFLYLCFYLYMSKLKCHNYCI